MNTPRDGEKSRVWTDVTFVELLMLILRAAQTSMEQPECASDVAAAGSDEASRASGRGKWDVAWQPKHGTAEMLYEALLSRQLQPLVPKCHSWILVIHGVLLNHWVQA